VRAISKSKFKAEAAMEGAKVAGALLKQVNFPTFVASLIQGVFHAIVLPSSRWKRMANWWPTWLRR
jgi:hypothetical protein